MAQRTITEQAFAKLGKERLLHEYSDVLRGLLGIIIDFASPDGGMLKLSVGENFNPYCQYIRQSASGNAACSQCDIKYAKDAELSRRELCYTCHAGLTDIMVPLFDRSGSYIGSVTAGQFHLNDNEELSRSQVEEIAGRFDLNADKLYQAYRQSPHLSKTQMDALLGFLNIIGRHLRSTHDNILMMEKLNTPEKIESVKKYLEDNFMKKLSINQVAKHFFISSGHLAHIFKKEMNVSFGNYLTFLRITKAREMLTDTSLSVSEISFLCGFGSISQFNRAFRKHLNCSPGEYRTENR
jgi:AraC-like DNA-binding protein